MFSLSLLQQHTRNRKEKKVKEKTFISKRHSTNIQYNE